MLRAQISLLARYSVVELPSTQAYGEASVEAIRSIRRRGESDTPYSRARLPLGRPRRNVAGERDADRRRTVRGDLRAGLSRPAARTRRWRRLPVARVLARRPRIDVRQREELAARSGPAEPVPLRRRVGDRHLRRRRRSQRQRRQRRPGTDLAAVRQRQPRHRRLRAQRRLLGFGRARPSRVSGHDTLTRTA